MVDLLPCPFCGGSAKPEDFAHEGEWITCPTQGCACEANYATREAWNTRAPDSRLLAAHEALLAAVDLIWKRMNDADPIVDAILVKCRNALVSLTAPGDDARREAEKAVIEAAIEWAKTACSDNTKLLAAIYILTRLAPGGTR